MKRSNVIGILAAAAVIVLSVVLISWYLTKRTPTLIQGTVECTTYKASSKVPGRIDDMKVAQGDRVEKGQLLYTLSTPELEAKLRQAEAVKSAAAALDAMALAGARAIFIIRLSCTDHTKCLRKPGKYSNAHYKHQHTDSILFHYRFQFSLLSRISNKYT